MEFLERTEVGGTDEHWIVRIDGEIATARVFFEEDATYNVQVATRTAPWMTFRHPRVVPLLAMSPLTPRFVITSGDERGVSIEAAARRLHKAGIDREAWAVNEIIAIADAITAMAAHQPGFLHERANPEQIVVGADGLARLRAPIAYVSVGGHQNSLGRAPGQLTGIAWMSPEQARGKPRTPASDVFQLATTLYTLVTGARAARGENDFDILQSIVHGPPPPSPPAHIAGLAAIIVRGMQRTPEERFPDVAAFAAALRGVVTGDPSPAILALTGVQVHPAPSRSAPIASGRCHKQWDELESTPIDGVRHCDSCRTDVVRVASVMALIPLLGKRCVAFQSDDD